MYSLGLLTNIFLDWRKNMKKLLAILLALSMVLSFAACGKDNSDEAATDNAANNDRGEVSVMGSLSDEEISGIAVDFESAMGDNVEAAEQFEQEYSELLKKSEYIDDYGLNDDGIDEAKKIFVNIFIEYYSDEEVDMYAEFFYATMKYERAMNVYETEISDYINNNYGSSDFKDGYVDMMCSYGVPEWYVRWMYVELFGNGGVVPENDNKNTCEINQRVLISELSNYFYGATVTGYTEITIEYDGSNVNVTVEGDAISYEQFIAIFDEIPYCPAQGTIMLSISMGYNGNVDIDCVCRNNQDDTDHSL